MVNNLGFYYTTKKRRESGLEKSKKVRLVPDEKNPKTVYLVDLATWV
jgi:hypothetical protein